MGLNITIKDDGVAENYSGVTKIKVPSMEGGDTEWVPEAESNMKVKKITANGTYMASSDNCKGYMAVMVEVPATQVTGIDKTDGKQYRIQVDSFGNILKIPVT